MNLIIHETLESSVGNSKGKKKFPWFEKVYLLAPIRRKAGIIFREENIYRVGCIDRLPRETQRRFYEADLDAMVETNYIETLCPALEDPFVFIHDKSEKSAYIAEYLYLNKERIKTKGQNLLVLYPFRTDTGETAAKRNYSLVMQSIQHAAEIFGYVFAPEPDYANPTRLRSSKKIQDFIASLDCTKPFPSHFKEFIYEDYEKRNILKPSPRIAATRIQPPLNLIIADDSRTFALSFFMRDEELFTFTKIFLLMPDSSSNDIKYDEEHGWYAVRCQSHSGSRGFDMEYKNAMSSMREHDFSKALCGIMGTPFLYLYSEGRTADAIADYIIENSGRLPIRRNGILLIAPVRHDPGDRLGDLAGIFDIVLPYNALCKEYHAGMSNTLYETLRGAGLREIAKQIGGSCDPDREVKHVNSFPEVRQ